MARRLWGLAILLVAIAGAAWTGTLVHHALEGPGPVATVRTATDAYADGDCRALRKVSVRPRSIECATVRQVRQAYEDQGLRPAEFTYALVAQDGGRATVRVSYVERGRPLEELISVEQHDGDWKISETGGQLE